MFSVYKEAAWLRYFECNQVIKNQVYKEAAWFRHFECNQVINDRFHGKIIEETTLPSRTNLRFRGKSVIPTKEMKVQTEKDRHLWALISNFICACRFHDANVVVDRAACIKSTWKLMSFQEQRWSKTVRWRKLCWGGLCRLSIQKLWSPHDWFASMTLHWRKKGKSWDNWKPMEVKR